MSGTVIDELVMKLGLDGSDFRKGADDAVKANKSLRDSATTTATTLESKGKIAASFWTEQKIGILGVLGVLAAGGKALEDITVKAGTASAAMGRAAQIGNTTPARLSGLQAVAREYGSTASEATAAINSILKAERDLRASGTVSSPVSALRQLGITAFDKNNQPIDPVVQIEQIAAALKGYNEQQALNFGERLGFSDTFTNALRSLPANNPAAIEKLIQSQATTSAAAAKAGEDFVTASGQLSSALTLFDNVVMNQLVPYLIPAIKDLTKALDWLGGHPEAATATAGAGAVVAGAAGVSLLKRAAAWFLGKGAAGAGEAAELTSAAETAGIAGSVALNPLALAALATFAATGPAGAADESAQLYKLFPNAPRGTPATVDRTLPPIAQNFLNTIGESESKDHYNALYGGGTFTGNQFPNWAGVQTGVDGNGNPIMTHAAGRYQFEPGTWARAAAALGLTDFSPASQDKAAWWLAQQDYRSKTGRDLLTDLRAHDPYADELIKQALAATWPSIVGDNLGSAASSPGLPSSVTSLLSRLRGEHHSSIYKALVAAGGSYTAVVNGMRMHQSAAQHKTTIHAPITVNGAKSPAATGRAVQASLNTLGVQSARAIVSIEQEVPGLNWDDASDAGKGIARFAAGRPDLCGDFGVFVESVLRAHALNNHDAGSDANMTLDFVIECNMSAMAEWTRINRAWGAGGRA
jgi:muramidase (phage lysozyme)